MLANERQLVLAILSREWKLGPRYASKALNDMIAEGVVWREWVNIERPNAEDYAQDVDLFEESSQFVAGG